MLNNVATVQQIALAFPRGAHQETFIEGVFRYVSEYDLSWSYTIAPESLALSIEELADWKGDGVLAAINTPHQAECAAKMDIPVVNISSALPESPVPRSMVDNSAIGRVAAEHLMSRGVTSFAYYGLRDIEYSKRRWMGFEQRLTQASYASVSHLATATFSFHGETWLSQHKELSDWLEALPDPCGVFAVSDYRARHILDVAAEVGRKVPDQVMVLGADNEQVICDHISPTLSSVARNDLLEGYRAAELMHRCLRGEPNGTNSQIAVPPGEVVERESTSTFAVSDPRLKAALKYLVENKRDPVTVQELADYVDVSRRWLEYAFRDALGESPYQYLQRERLNNAKRMLAEEPGTKIHRIAKLSGFTTEKQFRLSFQRAFGMTPGVFRRLSE